MTAAYSKNAAWGGGIFKDPIFVGHLAAAGVGLGAQAAMLGGGKLIEARQRANGFKEMLELNPVLKGRDQTQVQRIFNSLHKINPTLGNDPLVAGAWVHNVIENGGGDPSQPNQALLGAVKDLAGVRAQMAQAYRSEGTADMARSVGEQIGAVARSGADRYGDIVQRGSLAQLEKLREAEAKKNIEMHRQRDAAAKATVEAETANLHKNYNEAVASLMKREQTLMGAQDRFARSQKREVPAPAAPKFSPYLSGEHFPLEGKTPSPAEPGGIRGFLQRHGVVRRTGARFADKK